MQIIQTNVARMKAQLEQWGTELEALVTKAEAVGEDAKASARKRIEELEAKHQEARARLDELEAAGNEKWEIVEVGIENAWDELETAFEKLKN
jgi:hypothetical protein